MSEQELTNEPAADATTSEVDPTGTESKVDSTTPGEGESVSEKEAHIQTKWQKALEVMGEVDNSGQLVQLMKGEITADQLQAPPEQPPAPADEVYQKTVAEMTPAELQAMLTQHTQQTQRVQALNAARHQATKAINALGDVPQETHVAVMQQLQSMGITADGSWPTHFATAYINTAQTHELLNQHSNQNSQVEASARGKVEALQGTAQPEGASAPPPEGEKSSEQEMLDAMKQVTKNPAANEVFGT